MREAAGGNVWVRDVGDIGEEGLVNVSVISDECTLRDLALVVGLETVEEVRRGGERGHSLLGWGVVGEHVGL